ncbi:signal recognition particle receptor subunit alpha, partial [Haemophilus haemoglobinophilus]|nr:signal recognition particle receptor subunit alpha [Canicola haemoglobinophilus]
MSEEKKKGGFWSWLGLGKKKEETQITPQPEQQEVVAEPAILDVEPEIENPDQHIEETLSSSVEIVSNEEVIEELAHELVHTEDTTQETESAVEISEVSEEATIEISVEEANEQSFENEISAEQQEDAEINEIPKTVVQEQEKPSEGGFFSRLVKGLLKTKQNIGTGFRSLFLGKKIDDELFEELEEQLLIADIGVPTTTKIINNLTQHASRKQLQDADLL